MRCPVAQPHPSLSGDVMHHLFRGEGSVSQTAAMEGDYPTGHSRDRFVHPL